MRIGSKASNGDCVSILLAARLGSVTVVELEGFPDTVRRGAVARVVGGVRAAGCATSVGDEKVRAAAKRHKVHRWCELGKLCISFSRLEDHARIEVDGKFDRGCAHGDAAKPEFLIGIRERISAGSAFRGFTSAKGIKGVCPASVGLKTV